MSITTINNERPACYGVACAQHGECARYLAVEHTLEIHTMGTCDEHGRGERPMFVAAQATEA